MVRNLGQIKHNREEQGKSTDVVTGTLHVFSFPVYALLASAFTPAYFLS